LRHQLKNTLAKVKVQQPPIRRCGPTCW
jgi:hypothetical protein